MTREFEISLATLGRIIHERFTDPEVGRLLDRLTPLEESLPYDSDDASLIRVTRREWRTTGRRTRRWCGRTCNRNAASPSRAA